MSFNQARQIVRGLKLKNHLEWKKWHMYTKPKNIPVCPDDVYRDNGWIDFGDWLGTGNKWNHFNKMGFDKLREYARSLKFKNTVDWFNFWKPEMWEKGIVQRPDCSYEEWISWPDFLGDTYRPGHDETSIERKVRMSLINIGINFERQVKIGRKTIDFVIGDIALECYGEFDHGDPRKYKPDDLITKGRIPARMIWDQDAERTQYIEKRGYRVIILWEKEINSTFNLDDLISKTLGLQNIIVVGLDRWLPTI